MDSPPDMVPEPTPPTQPAPAPVIVARPLDTSPRPWLIIGQLLTGLLLALAAQFGLGFCAGLVLAVRARLGGAAPNPAELMRHVSAFFMGPTGMSLQILLTEAVFLGVALFSVRRLTGTKRENFGLPRPALAWTAYPLFILGALAMSLLGEFLATPVNELIPSMMDAQKLRSQVTWATGIPFVAIIALAPGFVEELLFRGYVQRRLLRDWRPWSAILFASVAFAIIHVDPVHIVFALPLGIWFGILAWRTNSIWPGVLGHMFVNALWNVYGICVAKLDISNASQLAVTIIAGVCALAGLIGSIIVLRRMPTPAVVRAQPITAVPSPNERIV